MATIEQTLAAARRHQQAGAWDAAEAAYRRVLRAAPDDADVLHSLGLLAAQTGRVAAAVEYLSRAVASRPWCDALHTNLGETYRRSGNLAAAVECFRRALAINPHSAAAHNNLGEALRALGQTDAAVAQYGRALEERPDFAEALNNLGEAHRTAGRLEKAVEAYRRAIEIKPELAEVHNNLAIVLARLDRPEEAIGQFDEALRLRPDFAEAHANLADVLREQGDLPQAVGRYRTAVRLRPGFAEAHNNLGNALRDMGRLDEAVAAYDAGLAIEPEHAGMHYNRSLAWLMGGEFARGWAEHRWRWRRPESPPRRCVAASWEGEPLAGKTLLVHGEQGIGDEIMFASCLADVIAAAGRCVVECDGRLVPLLARSFPAAEVYARRDGEDLTWLTREVAVDYAAPAGELPQYLRAEIAGFPRRDRYLAADAGRTDAWRRWLSALGEGPKIGISWQAGSDPKDSRRRSLPLDQWAPLLNVTGPRWVSVQYGARREEVDAAAGRLGRPIHVPPGIDPREELDELAAVFSALDLVVSVDNATVHLAGSLGRPTWVLLPYAASWRWMLDRGDSPWYPSLRLIRQRRPGDWAGVLASVAEELRRVVL